MNDTSVISDALENKLKELIVMILKLGDDVQIDPAADLVEQIGLDSIEAFDAVATVHELLGVSIPDNFDPRSVASLRTLSNYILNQFGAEMAQRFLDLDLSEIDLSRDVDV
jgi:acyl carrier protein